MKTILSTLLLAATLCASALASRPARAQIIATVPGNYYYQVPVYFPIPVPLHEYSQPEKSQTAKRKASTRRTVPKNALTTTTYRESPAVTKRVVRRFTDWAAPQTDATDAETIRRDYEDDMVGRWAKEVAGDGLKRGDVADALTSYWLINWQIANRVVNDLKPAQVRAVRRFFASTLASTPAFAKATNAQRQEIAEGYIYSAVMQGGAFGQIFRTGDQAQIKQFSDARAASFKTETGFDLRTVKLTNTGFTAKS